LVTIVLLFVGKASLIIPIKFCKERIKREYGKSTAGNSATKKPKKKLLGIMVGNLMNQRPKN